MPAAKKAEREGGKRWEFYAATVAVHMVADGLLRGIAASWNLLGTLWL